MWKFKINSWSVEPFQALLVKLKLHIVQSIHTSRMNKLSIVIIHNLLILPQIDSVSVIFMGKGVDRLGVVILIRVFHDHVIG